MATEVHQLNRKWVLLDVYKPPTKSDLEFLEEIVRIHDHYIPFYENILILSDFNMT